MSAFNVGSEIIVPVKDRKGLPHWQAALFAVLSRNAASITDYLELPSDHVVEIGHRVEI